MKKIAYMDARQIVLVEQQEREVGFKCPLILRRPREGMVLDSVHVASLYDDSFKCWRITQLFQNLRKRIDHLLRKNCGCSFKVGFSELNIFTCLSHPLSF